MGKANESVEVLRGPIEGYDGPWDLKIMPKEVKSAYTAWTNQWQRCNNPKRSDYKYYGALGVKVLYSKKDFIEWFLKELKSYAGDKPSIGRIDHNGNYCFENIRMESFTDNRRERWVRRGPCIGNVARPVALHSKKTHEIITVFESVNKCGEYLGIDSSVIYRNCKSKNPKGSEKHSWYYRFAT